MPTHIMKIKGGYVVMDNKGKVYSKKPLTKKIAIAQQNAIHYGGSFTVVNPQIQALQNVKASLEAQQKKLFGQNYSINLHADIARHYESRPKFGGHLYYSNI